MNSRAIATTILVIVILPLVLIGPEQYGYAFFGLLAGLGAFAKATGAESPLWMFFFSLIIIAVMILFSGVALVTIAYLVLRIAGRPQAILRYRSVKFIPLVFAMCVMLGLILLSLFPGEPPIYTSSVLFLAPFLLLLTAGVHAARTE